MAYYTWFCHVITLCCCAIQYTSIINSAFKLLLEINTDWGLSNLYNFASVMYTFSKEPSAHCNYAYFRNKFLVQNYLSCVLFPIKLRYDERRRIKCLHFIEEVVYVYMVHSVEPNNCMH